MTTSFSFFGLKICSPAWQILLRNNKEHHCLLPLPFPFSCNFQSSFNLANLACTRELLLFPSKYMMEMWNVSDRHMQWNNRENNLAFLVSNEFFLLTGMILCNLLQGSSTAAICHALWCNLMGSFLKWIMDYGLPLYINNITVSFI